MERDRCWKLTIVRFLKAWRWWNFDFLEKDTQKDLYSILDN